jgi:hypothetical protein
MKLTVASNGMAKWAPFYILHWILAARSSAFCSDCTMFLGKAKGKFVYCLRVFLIVKKKTVNPMIFRQVGAYSMF